MTPSQTLEKILTDYGSTVLQNSRRVESLFKDLCYEPEYKREVNILILALKEDIPQRLINANPVTEHLKNQLAQKIEDTYSVPVQHGKIAVDTWENALYPNKVKSSNTVPTQQQKPVQPATPTAKPSTTPTKQPIQPQTVQKTVQPVTPITQPISELDQGIWTDPKTGLTWARISIGQRWENGQCVGDAKKLNWHNAQKANENFRLAGFNDWRLPTNDELKTIIKGNHHLFNPSQKGIFWSSSSYNESNAWYIDAHKINSISGKSSQGFIRLVRGNAQNTPSQSKIQKSAAPQKTVQPVIAKPKPSTTPTKQPIQPQTVQKTVQPVAPQQQTTPPITELDQGVWADPNTGLMWARISIGQEWKNGKCLGDAKRLNWDNAKKECRNSKLANFNDWRLPTIDELKTLMIQGKSGYNCPQNMLYQPNKDSFGYYWSDSPNVEIYAWDVGFDYGTSNYGSKNYNYYVRAVRGNAKNNLTQQAPTIQKSVQPPTTQPIHSTQIQQSNTRRLLNSFIIFTIIFIAIGFGITYASYILIGGWAVFIIFIILFIIGMQIDDGNIYDSDTIHIFQCLKIGFWLYIIPSIFLWFYNGGLRGL